MARKAPPLQIVLMMACVGALMLISWLSISSPEAKEENKARTTLAYFLEAIGRSPIDRLGKELHPSVRRQYTPESLQKTLATLQLDQPLELSDWAAGEQTFEPRQWRWQLKTRAEGTNSAPQTLWAFIQYPEEVKISRRWHVRSLCRPETELPLATQALLSALHSDNPAENTPSPWLSDKGQYTAFLTALKDAPQTKQTPRMTTLLHPRLQSEASWQQERLVMQWEAEPGDALHCRYILQAYRLGSTIETPQTSATETDS